MVKPSAFLRSYTSWKPGISTRQGGHQVAQKLTSTTLPRSASRETAAPSRVVSWKSGAAALADATPKAAATCGQMR